MQWTVCVSRDTYVSCISCSKKLFCVDLVVSSGTVPNFDRFIYDFISYRFISFRRSYNLCFHCQTGSVDSSSVAVAVAVLFLPSLLISFAKQQLSVHVVRINKPLFTLS